MPLNAASVMHFNASLAPVVGAATSRIRKIRRLWQVGYLKSVGGVERPPVFEPQHASEPSSLMPQVLVKPLAIC